MAVSQNQDEIVAKLVEDLGITRRIAKKAASQALDYEGAKEVAEQLKEKEDFAVGLLETSGLERRRMSLARSLSSEVSYDPRKAAFAARRVLVGEKWHSMPHLVKPSYPKELASRIEHVLEMVRPCYQCGKCAGHCPVFCADETKNPRVFIERIILGKEKELLESTQFWNCAFCLSCSQHCPQGVDLAHALIELKNIASELGAAPQSSRDEVKLLWDTGRVSEESKIVMRRRNSLGLPELMNPDVDSIRAMLEATGFKVKLDKNLSSRTEEHTSE
jgi:heterodisulfide reductase subunit C